MHDDRLYRVDEVLVERGDRALDGQLLARSARRRVVEERGGQVQAEVSERLGPVWNLAENRRVGQRMAVDLTGHPGRDLPGGGLRVSPLKVGVVLAEVQGSGERDARVRAGRQARQPAEEEVDLQLGADRLRRLVAFLAEEAPQDPGGNVGEHEAGTQRLRLRVAADPHVDLGVTLTAPDRGDLGVHGQFRACLGGDGRERVGDRAHPADRHPPLARPVADDVVEEAAVLDERRVVQPGEGADQRIGRDHAPHGRVTEAALDGRTERPFGQFPPQVLIDLLPQCRRPRQRLGEGRGDDRGKLADPAVEVTPGLVLGVGSRQGTEALPGRRSLGPLNEQPGGGPVPAHRGVGSRRA